MYVGMYVRMYVRMYVKMYVMRAVPDRNKSLEVGKCAQKVKIGERA